MKFLGWRTQIDIISVVYAFTFRCVPCQRQRWVVYGDWPVPCKQCVTSPICVLYTTLALARRAFKGHALSVKSRLLSFDACSTTGPRLSVL